MEREAVAFFKKYPDDLFLVLDDAEYYNAVSFFKSCSYSMICFASAAGSPKSQAPPSFNGMVEPCLQWADSEFHCQPPNRFLRQSKVFSALCKAYQRARSK